MKRALFVGAALVVALFTGAMRASADNVRYGVNDDEGLFEKGAGPFFPTLTGLGMRDNTMTVRWDETAASGFEDLGNGVTLQSFLPGAVAAANLAGVTITFDVYPRHSLAAGNPAANAPRFAAWLKTLAQTYPSVTHYVVMNECNQPLFVNPQYDSSGALLSAADCGQFLAAGYRALKAVNPGIFVWGIGLSPHGAKVDGGIHRDASPFDFLAALGAWYKASPYSGQPIMDGLDLHPYPIPQSTPFAQGNAGGSGPAYGVATLPLVYQAFYDAFAGTAQPTVGPGRLPVSLNEVGIQTVPTIGGYTGTETRNWGVDGQTGSQAYQAQWYKQLIDSTECDASITNVNIFKLLDQSDLGAWQSGLYQLGWVPKVSTAVVGSEIASVTSCPTGAAAYWSPAVGAAPADAGSAGVPAQNGALIAGDPSRFATGSPQAIQQSLKVVSPGPLVLGLNAVFRALGTIQVSGTGSVLLVPSSPPPPRVPAAAPKLPAKTFALVRGKAIRAPRLGKPRAGAYRLKIVLRAAGAAPVTLLSAPFTLDAQGRVLLPAKAKPAKAKSRPGGRLGSRSSRPRTHVR